MERNKERKKESEKREKKKEIESERKKRKEFGDNVDLTSKGEAVKAITGMVITIDGNPI